MNPLTRWLKTGSSWSQSWGATRGSATNLTSPSFQVADLSSILIPSWVTLLQIIPKYLLPKQSWKFSYPMSTNRWASGMLSLLWKPPQISQVLILATGRCWNTNLVAAILLVCWIVQMEGGQEITQPISYFDSPLPDLFSRVPHTTRWMWWTVWWWGGAIRSKGSHSKELFRTYKIKTISKRVAEIYLITKTDIYNTL